MTKRSIFAKIFLITFALFSSLVILLHASVYFIFPSTYIESQRQTILKKSQALAKSFQGQEEGTIESVIDLYSKTNDPYRLDVLLQLVYKHLKQICLLLMSH